MKQRISMPSFYNQKVQPMENLKTYGIFIVIIILTFVIATIFRKLFGKYIRYSTQNLKNDPTNYQFLLHSLTAMIYLIGIGWALFTLPTFKAIASSMLTGAGILALVAGFASQHALSNVMSGIFVIIFKPFRVGDRLKIKDTLNGFVEDITLRHTVIRDLENKRIIIPNTVISNEIIVNSDYVDEKICKIMDFSISYESDLKLAKKIIAEETENHSFFIDIRNEAEIKDNTPKVIVRVISLGESSVNLRTWAWAQNNATGFVLACDLLESIKLRFDAEGIEIPYPHRTIVQKTV